MEKVTDKNTTTYFDSELDKAYQAGVNFGKRAGLEEAARAADNLLKERGEVNCLEIIAAIRAMAQPEPPTAYEMSRISPQLCEVHGVVHKCELMAAPAAAKIGEWRCKKCKHEITDKSNICLAGECDCECEVEGYEPVKGGSEVTTEPVTSNTAGTATGASEAAVKDALLASEVSPDSDEAFWRFMDENAGVVRRWPGWMRLDHGHTPEKGCFELRPEAERVKEMEDNWPRTQGVYGCTIDTVTQQPTAEGSAGQNSDQNNPYRKLGGSAQPGQRTMATQDLPMTSSADTSYAQVGRRR